MLLLLAMACSDYKLNTDNSVDTAGTLAPTRPGDTAPPADTEPPEDTEPPQDTAPPPEETCDGVDNDLDGGVDEGFDADGDGTADCFEIRYEVSFHVTADDWWEGWIDGVYFDEAGGWSAVDTHTATLDSGEHVLAIHAEDQAQAIAGLLAAVSVDGAVTWVTGDGSWRIVSADPGGTDWRELVYDDAGWAVAAPCADPSIWAGGATELTAMGAQWVWWSADCLVLGASWSRMTFSLP